MSKIKNAPLREQIHGVLEERILQWGYAPGAALKDTEIAEELGISRTPVREALLRLAREGLVDNRQGRGFSVRPIQKEEMVETYPILWTMESLALSLSPASDPEGLSKLEELNSLLADPNLGPLQRVEIDAQWHSTLISNCPNGHLLELIQDLRLVVRRHELGYMRDGVRVIESVDFHQRIAHALMMRDTAHARELLEEHWRTSLEVWLSVPVPS